MRPNSAIRPLLLCAALLVVLPTECLVAQELSSTLVAKARRATVEVHIKGKLRGGGAFVKNEAGKVYVLTAAHLFTDPRDTCAVVTEDDRSHFASLSGYDLGHDLALLEVDPSLARYGQLRIAASLPGETKPLFNFGPALKRRILVLPGAVADARTSYTDFSASRDYLAHFFVSGINPVFSSGGPWVNREGEIVGVQHGRLRGDEGAPSSGLSMVSPPSALRALVARNAVASTPGVGGFLWEAASADRALRDRHAPDATGLIVNPVFPDRPLALAAIKAGDLIVACEGEAVERIHTFLQRLRSRPPGSPFRLEVVSPGKKGSREVVLTTDTVEAMWR